MAEQIVALSLWLSAEVSSNRQTPQNTTAGRDLSLCASPPKTSQFKCFRFLENLQDNVG